MDRARGRAVLLELADVAQHLRARPELGEAKTVLGEANASGISSSRPRRRRDSSPRNIELAAAAGARRLCGLSRSRPARLGEAKTVLSMTFCSVGIAGVVVFKAVATPGTTPRGRRASFTAAAWIALPKASKAGIIAATPSRNGRPLTGHLAVRPLAFFNSAPEAPSALIAREGGGRRAQRRRVSTTAGARGSDVLGRCGAQSGGNLRTTRLRGLSSPRPRRRRVSAKYPGPAAAARRDSSPRKIPGRSVAATQRGDHRFR